MSERLGWWGCALFVAGVGCSSGDGAGGAESEAGASSSADPTSTSASESTSGATRSGSDGWSDSAAPGTSSSSSMSSTDSATTPTGSDTDAPAELWRPQPGASWQWQLIGDIDPSFDVEAYDIDLFDAPTDVIDALHADGRVVICYFSAGSYEQWRSDADAFPSAAVGDPLDEWPGEAWLDHRDATIREIMAARLDLAVDKDCDAVEPDNVDGYTNPTGFALSAEDQLDYNRWLAAQAHARGLSVGLKNDVDQIEALVDEFDWALNEECLNYDECDTTTPFIEAGKAVFHVEYVDDPSDGAGLAGVACPQTSALGFSTLIKEWDLTPWRIACR